MRKSEKGFSPLLVLVILLVIMGVGFVAYRIIDNKGDSNTDQSTSSQEISDTKEPNSAIVDVDLELKSTEDIEKLPSTTPDSFKSFMRESLKVTSREHGCIRAYNISKVSKVNIEGGAFPVKANEGPDGEDCFGGVPALWVLAPNGTWEQVGRNANTTCKSENGGLVYEEFAAECYTDTDLKNLIKNPNGSVASLKN